MLFETSRRWNQRRDAAKRLTFQRCDIAEMLTFPRHDVESNVVTFPRRSTRKFLQKFSKCRKLPTFSFTLPKACTKLSMLFLLAATTSEPRTLQHKYIKIKPSKIKPSKLKTRKTDDQNNLKAWVASQVALCLLSLARLSYVSLTGAQSQWTFGKPTFRGPEHCLCWFQTCGGLVLLELTSKIRLHLLPIHLKSTSFRIHQLDTTVGENLGDHKRSRPS